MGYSSSAQPQLCNMIWSYNSANMSLSLSICLSISHTSIHSHIHRFIFSNFIANVLEVEVHYHLHWVLCHCCTHTAVKPSMNLMGLKGLVLISFWLHLLGVCIDPVGVYWIVALPVQLEEKVSVVKTMKLSHEFERTRTVFFLKRRESTCIQLLLYILLDLLFLGLLHIPTLLWCLPKPLCFDTLVIMNLNYTTQLFCLWMHYSITLKPSHLRHICIVHISYYLMYYLNY